MKGMILAAGLGTRLAPLTDHLPKALVPVNGKPMLDHVLERMVKAGFDRVIVNVCHFHELIIRHLEKNAPPGVAIEISDESQGLLDTGGAIWKAQWFLDGKEPFLVHNTDVISNVNLRELMRFHVRAAPLATLAVSDRKSTRSLLMDDDLVLHGWENAATGERKPGTTLPEDLRKLSFSGIHVLNPGIFRLIERQGRFTIIDVYLELCGTFPVRGFQHDTEGWFDLGRKDQLAVAEKYLQDNRLKS